MLTLRDDVRAKLNDHRLFDDIHQKLMNNENEIKEEALLRITARSHHAHYVQSPLLLFTSWRYQIAQIRKNLASHVGMFGKMVDGGGHSALPPLVKKHSTAKSSRNNSPDTTEKSTSGPILKSMKVKHSSGTKTRSKTLT